MRTSTNKDDVNPCSLKLCYEKTCCNSNLGGILPLAKLLNKAGNVQDSRIGNVNLIRNCTVKRLC